MFVGRFKGTLHCASFGGGPFDSAVHVAESSASECLHRCARRGAISGRISTYPSVPCTLYEGAKSTSVESGATLARRSGMASPDLAEEPGLRRFPVPHDGLRRDVQHVRCLIDGQTA